MSEPRITKPRLDWIHGVLLGGVFTIILFTLVMAHSGGVCR
jgi:hypothetical protein